MHAVGRQRYILRFHQFLLLLFENGFLTEPEASHACHAGWRTRAMESLASAFSHWDGRQCCHISFLRGFWKSELSIHLAWQALHQLSYLSILIYSLVKCYRFPNYVGKYVLANYNKSIKDGYYIFNVCMQIL